MSIIIQKQTSKSYRHEIKVISWNLDIKNKDTKLKINELIEKNADIIMLQECYADIKSHFDDYISYDTVKGYKGNINLFIHKRLNSEIYSIFKDNGLLIYHLNTSYGQIIVASIQLPPFNKINNKILRTIYIYKIIDFLKNEKLTKLPIIIGGDTNMQDDEHIRNLSENILEDLHDNYENKNNYYTCYIHKINLNKKYRFNRFFYSNLKIKNFNTLISNNSKYFMIETDIIFGNIFVDSINTKFDKLKKNYFSKKNHVYVL